MLSGESQICNEMLQLEVRHIFRSQLIGQNYSHGPTQPQGERKCPPAHAWMAESWVH